MNKNEKGSFRMNKSKKNIVLAGILFSILVFLGVAFWHYGIDHSRIEPYQSERDRASLITIFDQNWYWLTNMSRDEYSFEFHLDHLTPTRSPEDFGSLSLYVLRDGEKTKGFVAFYKKTKYRAKILFVAVAKEYRRKGYAKKLMRYALDLLQSDGFKVVELVTRTRNKAAQKLYTSLGFRMISDVGGYVDFEKKL